MTEKNLDKYCHNCGKSLSEDSAFCANCGTNLKHTSESIPEEILGWNWGAFFLSWIWAIGNKVWIGLLALIPYFGFIWIFVLGYKGNEWAWKAKKYESVKHFKSVQRKWAIAGLILWLIIPTIGVFASIALVSLTGVQRSARDTQRKSDLASYRAALEGYYVSKGQYPISKSDSSYPATGIFSNSGPLTSDGYLPRGILDPSNGSVTCKETVGNAFVTCEYKYFSNGTSYNIWSYLENPTSEGGIFYINSDGKSGYTVPSTQ